MAIPDRLPASITIKVGGEDRTREFSKTQLTAIERAFDSIRQSPSLQNRLNQEGVKLSASEEGLVYEDAGRRQVNVLSDVLQAGEEYDTVNTTFQLVQDVMGRLFDGEGVEVEMQIGRAEEVHPGLVEWMQQAGVRAQAEVVEIEALNIDAGEDRVLELQANTRLAALKEAATPLQEALAALNIGGGLPAASTQYGRTIPELYTNYCRALREWKEVEQRVGAHFDETMSRDVYALGKELYQIQRFDAGAIHAVGADYHRYVNAVEFAAVSAGRVEQAVEDERHFLAALERIDGTDDVQVAARASIQVLERTHELFAQGALEEGLKYYTDNINTVLGVYQRLGDVMPRQRQEIFDGNAEGLARLDLNRIALHHQMITELSAEQKSRGLDVLDFQKPIGIVGHQLGAFLAASKTDLTRALEIDVGRSARKKADRYQQFVDYYQRNRQYMDRLMAEKGISPLETATTFNHYQKLAAAYRTLAEGFEEAADLSRAGEDREAVDRLARVFEENSEAFFAAAKESLPFTLLMAREGVGVAINQFATGVGLPQPNVLVLDLGIGRLSTELNLWMQGLEGALDSSSIQASERFTVAKARVAEQTNEINEYSRTLERLYGEVDNDFSQWNAVWDEGRLDEFTQLYKLSGALVKEVQDVEQAIALETDPLRQRALLRQFDLLLEKKHVEFKALHTRFEKVGGMRELVRLKGAVQGEDVAAVQARIDLMSKRIRVFNGILQRRHMVVPFEENAVTNAMDRMDPKPDVQGLRMEVFNKWFNAFQKESSALRCLWGRLQEDPDNIALQQEFTKLLDKQLPKLEALTKGFDKAITRQNMVMLSGVLGVRFDQQVDAIHNEIDDIIDFANTGLSWEKGFLNDLTDMKSPLGKAIDVELSSAGLTKKDLKAIQKLFTKYQDPDLAKLQKVERAYEENPLGRGRKPKLLREMKETILYFEKLEGQYAQLQPKIAALQGIMEKIPTALPDLRYVCETKSVARAFEQKRAVMLDAMDLYGRKNLERDLGAK